MAVYDRWHTVKPRTDEQSKPVPPCREHKQFPSVDHGKGDRWQVRWRDETGKQRKSNFAKKAGKDPNTCADAFDAKIRASLDAGTYVDPARGKVLLEDFAKRWRSGLTGDPNTLWNVDKRLAHIIDVQPRPGQGKSRRPTGDPSVIAKQPMSVLAMRPSLVQQWIKSLERKGLSPGYIKRIVDTLSTIFIAAMEDGLVDRNPTKASSVKPPRVPKKKVVPWTLDQVESAAEALGKDAAMVYLGVGVGLRQGEIFGLAVDDIDLLGNRIIHVRRQVRLVSKRLVFSLPKGDKERDIPLPNSLGLRLSAHIAAHQPVEITLPWKTPDGPPHTARLLFARPSGQPHHGASSTTCGNGSAELSVSRRLPRTECMSFAIRRRRPGSLRASTSGPWPSTSGTLTPASRSGRTRICFRMPLTAHVRPWTRSSPWKARSRTPVPCMCPQSWDGERTCRSQRVCQGSNL